MAGIATEPVAERVRALLTPILARDGYDIVEVEWLREGRWVLRLFIDKAGGAGGIGIEDCQAVSRLVEPILDVEDFIEPSYNLEVSSPGLERPLRRPEDFDKHSGKRAHIRTYGPLDTGEAVPRKNWHGTLRGFRDGCVEIEDSGRLHRVPHERIAKAHLEYDFDSNNKE
jgi:ribosome maturation factor RimP